MAFNGYMKFNNISSKSFPVILTTPPQPTHPDFVTEEYNIPGRNGTLYSVNGQRASAQITVNLALVASDTWTNSVPDYTASYRQVRQWLQGTGRLEFEDRMDAFFEVQKIQITTDERVILNYGNMQVVFTVYPYEFLKSGEEEQANLNNPGDEAMPLYKITATGSGSGTLTVNGYSLSYSFTGAGELYIDTRRQIAYDAQHNNKNSKIAGDYNKIKLKHGTNTVAATMGTLKVYPNWGYNI